MRDNGITTLKRQKILATIRDSYQLKLASSKQVSKVPFHKYDVKLYNNTSYLLQYYER